MGGGVRFDGVDTASSAMHQGRLWKIESIDERGLGVAPVRSEESGERRGAGGGGGGHEFLAGRKRGVNERRKSLMDATVDG